MRFDTRLLVRCTPLPLPLLVVLALAAPRPASAYQIFFNEADFLAATASVVTEDFSEGDVSVNAGLFAGPLDATTDNGIFSAGDIAAGLSIQALNPGSNLKLYDGPYFTMPGNHAISNTDDSHPLQLMFSPTVTAVGFDLIFESPTISNAGVTVFDAGNAVVLGELEIDDLTYLGIVAEAGDAAISKVVIDNPFGAPSGRFEAVDNVSFGTALATESSTPEPGSLALLGLGVLALAWRRRLPVTA